MARKDKKLRELRLGVAAQRIFFVSMVLALGLAVIFPRSIMVASVLVILGLIIGALNITAKEIHLFLLASITLILTISSLYILPFVGTFIKGIFEYLLYLIAPAAALVAFGVFYNLASSR
jgi:hypothetical protein